MVFVDEILKIQPNNWNNKYEPYEEVLKAISSYYDAYNKINDQHDAQNYPFCCFTISSLNQSKLYNFQTRSGRKIVPISLPLLTTESILKYLNDEHEASSLSKNSYLSLKYFIALSGGFPVLVRFIFNLFRNKSIKYINEYYISWRGDLMRDMISKVKEKSISGTFPSIENLIILLRVTKNTKRF